MSVLAGKRVLVVEDEPLVAFALEDMLIELGCEIVGPAMRLADALVLAAEGEIEAAVLDVNIDGDRSYAVADELDRRAVPYLFATGYGRAGLDVARRDQRVLSKPYRQHELERELRAIFADAAAPST